VYVDLDVRTIQILHGELLRKASNEESLYGVYAGDLVRQQRSLRLVPVLQEHQSWGIAHRNALFCQRRNVIKRHRVYGHIVAIVR